MLAVATNSCAISTAFQVRTPAPKLAEVLLLRRAPGQQVPCRPDWRGLTGDRTRSTPARFSSSRTRILTLVLALSATQPAGVKKRPRPSMPAGGSRPWLARLGLSGVYADLQGEYAQRDVAFERFFSLERSLGRALYLAAHLGVRALGLELGIQRLPRFRSRTHQQSAAPDPRTLGLSPQPHHARCARR